MLVFFLMISYLNIGSLGVDELEDDLSEFLCVSELPAGGENGGLLRLAADDAAGGTRLASLHRRPTESCDLLSGLQGRAWLHVKLSASH